MNSHISDLPVYEPGKPIEYVAKELGFKNIEEIIKVASNENEFGPSKSAIKAMKNNASNMHRYPDGACFELKEKLSSIIKVAPQNIIFGNGSNELIEFLGHALLNENSNWVVSEYSFAVYRLVAALFNSKAIEAKSSDNFSHCLSNILSSINEQTRAVIICNPNNPTGTYLKSEEIALFLDKVPRDVVVIVDEAYIEYSEPSSRFDFFKLINEGRENLIVLRTFSKIYGLAGLRLGYGVGSKNIIDALNKIKQPFNANLMAQKAAIAALDDQKYLEKIREINSSELNYFYEELTKMKLEFVKSDANFILVKTLDGREVFKELQKQKIIVRPMDSYSLPEWIRITVGKPSQNKKIISTLKKVLFSDR